MAETAQITLLPAARVAQQVPLQQALNGISYASYSDTHVEAAELERVINAIPTAIAHSLSHRGYYFVPLTIHEGDNLDFTNPDSGETLVAAGYSVDLSDRAICHRNIKVGRSEHTFISTRLMREKFALAFELFINVGHHFVDAVGVPAEFADLVWSHALSNVRGETSQDAWENRRLAIEGVESSARLDSPANLDRAPASVQQPATDGKAKVAFLEAAFADALAIYMLSLSLDFEYGDLREREYPLLAAGALAERLRHVARLYPPNPCYEFQIRYRRRGLS